MSMHERTTRKSEDITREPEDRPRRSQDITRKPRRKRRPPSGSLAPLFWILGIVLFLGVGVTVTLLLVKKKDPGQTEQTLDKDPPGPAVDPFAVKPPPPPPPQVTVLPPCKGKDPVFPPPKLQQAIAAIDQVEQGWRLADIEDARPFLDPTQNAAVTIYTAARLLPPGWESSPPGIFPHSVSPTQAHTPEQAAATRDHLKRVPQALAEARQLINLPLGRFRIEYRLDMLNTPVDYVKEVIKVGRLLESDAELRAYQGEGEKALESNRAMFHAARSLSEPVTLCQLARGALQVVSVNVLERVLSTKNGPSEQSLRALQEELEEEGRQPLLPLIYRGERASFHYLLTNVINGDTTLAAAAGAPAVQVTPEDHAWYLDYMSKVVAAAWEPPQRQVGKFAELTNLANTAPRGAKGIIPSFTKINTAANRALARLRSAAVAIAVERYRMQNGQWPPNLEALVGVYIKELPVDPYTGNFFKYVRQPEGVAIYCPVAQGMDNGGRFAGMNGETPSLQGFRLLEVKSRR